MKTTSIGIIPYRFSENGVSILLMRSSKKNDRFDFVKGKIEPYETRVDCCLREVQEEIGVSLSKEDLDFSVKQYNKKKNIELFFIHWDKYLYKQFKLDEREVFELKWFNLNEIPTISQNQRLIITKINERFNKLHQLLRSNYV